MSDEPRTLFAVRARSRIVREVWQLGKIMLGLAALFVVLGLVQLGTCKYNFPKRSVRACLVPTWGTK